MLVYELVLMLGISGAVRFITNTEIGDWLTSPFNRFEWISRALRCPFCCGFWIAFLYWLFISSAPFLSSMLSFCDGMLFCFSAAIISLVVDRIIISHEASYRLAVDVLQRNAMPLDSEEQPR